MFLKPDRAEPGTSFEELDKILDKEIIKSNRTLHTFSTMSEYIAFSLKHKTGQEWLNGDGSISVYEYSE